MEYTECAVIDGDCVLKFQGALLAQASSCRAGSQRWAEVAVYRLPQAGYVVERMGVSSVVHDPSCRLVRNDMIRWADSTPRDRARTPHLTPCLTCLPNTSEMDAQYRLERTISHGYILPDAASVVDLLIDGRERIPLLVRRLLEISATADPEIAKIFAAS